VHYLVQSSANMKIVKAKTTIENVFVVNQQFYVSTYLPGEQKQEQEVGLGCSKETCRRLVHVTLFTTVFHVNDIFCCKKSKKIGSFELYFSNVVLCYHQRRASGRKCNFYIRVCYQKEFDRLFF
jgi:hypothetical protein